MKNRFLKQFLYGLFFLSIFFIIGFLIYLYFKPSATCSDNKKNNDETEIDCGGSCVACEIKNSSGLKIISQKIIPAGDNFSTLIFEINNPLSNFGVSDFSYAISLKNSSGSVIYNSTKESFIYPGERKTIIEPGISVSFDSVSKIEIDLKGEKWIAKDYFKIPKVEYRDLKISPEGKFINVSGIITSGETVSLPEIIVNVIFYGGQGELLGASRTIMEDMESFGEKSFFVSHPVINADLSKTVIMLEAKRPGSSGFLYDSF